MELYQRPYRFGANSSAQSFTLDIDIGEKERGSSVTNNAGLERVNKGTGQLGEIRFNFSLSFSSTADTERAMITM